MKRVISLVLSFMIFLASFQNSLFYVDYQLNTEYYEAYCINKQKPELQCNGKCEVRNASNETNSPISEIKFAFELNILPSKPIEIVVKSPFEYQSENKIVSFKHIFTLDGYLHILPDPPQDLA